MDRTNTYCSRQHCRPHPFCYGDLTLTGCFFFMFTHVTTLILLFLLSTIIKNKKAKKKKSNKSVFLLSF